MSVNFIYRRLTICCLQMNLAFAMLLGFQNSLAYPPDRIVPDRFGYELEMDSRHLSRVVNIFDLEKSKENFYRLLNKELLTNASTPSDKADAYYQNRILMLLSRNIDSYLYNEEAFWNLPESLRSELSKGLNLNKKDTLEVKENTLLQAQSRGKQLTDSLDHSQDNVQIKEESQSRIILDPYSLDAGSRTKNNLGPQSNKTGIINSSDFTRSSNGLYIPESIQRGGILVDSSVKKDLEKKSDWPVVHIRWKGLPFKEKLKHFNFDYASDFLKASLIFESNHKTKNVEYAINALPLLDRHSDFMRNMEYHFEGITGNWYLEIKPDTPMTMTDVVKSLRQKFSSLAIPWDRSVLVDQQRSDLGLHLHLGFSNPNQVNIEHENRLIQNYNLLTLIRLLANPANQGVLQTDSSPDFAEKRQRAYELAVNYYHLPIASKGLIRWIDRGHIEVRELTKSADETIKEISELYLLSDKDGKTKVANEIKKALGQYPKILKTIEQNNYIVLFELGELLGDSKYIEDAYAKLTYELIHRNPKSVQDLQYIHSSNLFFRLVQRLIEDHKDSSPEVKKAITEVISIYHIKHASTPDFSGYNIFNKIFTSDFHKFFILTMLDTGLEKDFKDIILKSCQVKLTWEDQKLFVKKILNNDFLQSLISNELKATDTKFKNKLLTDSAGGGSNADLNFIEAKRFEVVAGMLALFGDRSHSGWGFYENFNEQLSMLPSDIRHLFLLMSDSVQLPQGEINFSVFKKILSIQDVWTRQQLNTVLKRSLKSRNPVLWQLWNKLFAGEINIRQMETLYKESREQKISDLSKMFPLTAVKKKPEVSNCNKIYAR